MNHFNFEKKYFNYLQKIIAISAVVIFAVLSFMPLFFAIKRLQTVTGVSVFSAISTFFDRPANLESLSFTLVEASVSALATVLIGLPIAWHLARSEWKHVRLVRALLAVPFVTPNGISRPHFRRRIIVEYGDRFTIGNRYYWSYG